MLEIFIKVVFVLSSIMFIVASIQLVKLFFVPFAD